MIIAGCWWLVIGFGCVLVIGYIVIGHVKFLTNRVNIVIDHAKLSTTPPASTSTCCYSSLS